MEGGGAKVIPAYPDANDPGKPADTKVIQQRHPPAEQKPYMRLEMYEQKKKQAPPQQPLQYLPTMTQYPAYPVPGQMATYAPPIVANNIYIGEPNPMDNHGNVNAVYEDLLPMKDMPNSQNTISERSSLFNYVRSVILNNKDGTKISFRTGKNNLFERLKTTELNPYHYGGIKDNPYSTLPQNMLLYRSCYPIKVGPYGNTCSKDSLGMNIRIYRMTKWEMSIGHIPDAEFYKSEVWREIKFYEYVRENILKKNVCPNFVMLFGYSLCDDSEINFDAIDKMKIDKVVNPKTVVIKDKVGQAPYVPIVGMMANGLPVVIPPQVPKVQQKMETVVVMTATGQPILTQRPVTKQIIPPAPVPASSKGEFIMPNPNAYDDDVLTALTESPTYNFMQWASKNYAQNGPNYQMIHTGYYSEKIWYSVLFQLMAALYTLQKHRIHINQFSLKDNVYIKDLTNVPTATNYWKYIINGVSYYVPNYGFLVLIDSKFNEPIPSFNAAATGNPVMEQRIQMSSSIFNDPNALTDDEINTKIFDTFTEVFNKNNFNSEFEQNGGVHPPPEIISFFDAIYSSIKAETAQAAQLPQTSVKPKRNISDYIYVYMRRFMNNRIGTYLTKPELEYIQRLNKNFRYGEIIVYEEKPDTFKFVLFGGQKSKGLVHILDRNINATGGLLSNVISSKDIPIGNLYSYSQVQPIKQDYKMNDVKLDEADMLETYVL